MSTIIVSQNPKKKKKKKEDGSYHVHGKGDGEVEGVVGGLVLDDEGVLLDRESAQVDVVLRGSDEIQELAELSLVGGLVEELDQVNVVGILSEMLLEEEVDGRLENEGVVDSNVVDTLLCNGQEH